MLTLLALAVTAIVLAAFSIDTIRNAPETFVAMLAIGILAIVLDAVWRSRRPASAASSSITTSTDDGD